VGHRAGDGLNVDRRCSSNHGRIRVVRSSRKSPFRVLLTALGLALVAVALPRASAQADPLAVVAGEALDIRAERLNIDVDNGTATLQGEVYAKLGELEVRCPRVEIRYDEAPRVRWAKGTGGVEATVRGIQARAQVVEVDVAKRHVNLSGGVHLSRGRGWVQADQATIDLSTRKVSLRDVKGSIPVESPKR
jgi:lipopolysaccharide export system protein LptA